MAIKRNIRRNDTVEIVCGARKGSRGRVLRAIPQKGKILVEGVNIVLKHVRPDPRRHPRGGRDEREMPIDASNAMLLCQNRDCERHDRPVRTGTLVDDDGKKHRVCVKCRKPIITPQ